MPIYSGVIQAASFRECNFSTNKNTTAGKKRRIPETLADSQVLLEPGQETLPDFLAEHKVHVIASLPSSLDQNGDLKESKRRDVEERSLGICLKVFNSYLFHSKIVICLFRLIVPFKKMWYLY